MLAAEGLRLKNELSKLDFVMKEGSQLNSKEKDVNRKFPACTNLMIDYKYLFKRLCR